MHFDVENKYSGIITHYYHSKLEVPEKTPCDLNLLFSFGKRGKAIFWHALTQKCPDLGFAS